MPILPNMLLTNVSTVPEFGDVTAPKVFWTTHVASWEDDTILQKIHFTIMKKGPN